MQRCLALAQKAFGNTYPNPMVGAVIVYRNSIIGEGWHHQAGRPHAEVNAINNVKDKSLLAQSTLYVNLEPCSHFGKTPPCIELIKVHKIPRVVIGSTDPNPKVSGNGIAALKKWGCEVTQGVLKKEADFLNRRFFTFHQKKRPYLILKWAQTADQFIAPLTKEKTDIFWITKTLARQRVHQWRSEESAILVGVQTVIDDNPQLTTRDWKGSNPLRLVLDPNARVPKKSILYKDKNSTIFFNKNHGPKEREINKFVVLDPFHIKTFLTYCFENEIQSILVEGGKKTLQNFIDDNLWDEARIFTANKKLIQGVTAPSFDAKIKVSEKLAGDRLDFYFN